MEQMFCDNKQQQRNEEKHFIKNNETCYVFYSIIVKQTDKIFVE